MDNGAAHVPSTLKMREPRSIRVEPVSWAPAWSRFRVSEYAATGTLALGSLSASLLASTPHSPRWRGGILLDNPVRDALRLGTQSGRDAADSASNGLFVVLVAAPFALDGIEYLAHRETGDAAYQVLMIDAQSMLVTASSLLLAKYTVARERPYGATCQTDHPDASCGGSDQNTSFFSGHTALSFTSASLVCTTHQNLHPLGGAADTAVCITALAGATATGALRIMADKHYLTDVATGAAFGVFSGYFLPKLLHYRGDGGTIVAPWLDPVGGGGITIGGAL
jgi:membrane-associated phospholipid phosphatase